MTKTATKSEAVNVATADDEEVLAVEDLKVYYDTPSGPLKAVDGVTFTMKRGERLAIVGESGSGKSTLAVALMRLTREPGRVVGGTVMLDGRNIFSLTDEEIRQMRLSEIALVPQGAMNSLNPVMRVEAQMVDGILDHSLGSKPSKQDLSERVVELLRSVGLPANVARMYPHELSGGMKQRVAMATATSLGPKIIVADEPSSALDVVVQRQIMQTLRRLQDKLGASTLLIGHDMGLVAQFADTIGVMYAGKIVELASVRQIFQAPRHPYTKLLIKSLPSLAGKGDFVAIPGLPPTLLDLPQGCSFHPRCPDVLDKCRSVIPAFQSIGNDSFVACHLYDKEKTIGPSD